MLVQALSTQSPACPPHSPPAQSLSAPLPTLRPGGGSRRKSTEGRSAAHLAQPGHKAVPLVLSGITHTEHCLVCQECALSLSSQTMPQVDSGQGKDERARWVPVRSLSERRACHQSGLAGAPPQSSWPHSPPPYSGAGKGRRN